MYELIEAIMNDDHIKTNKLIDSNPELILKLNENDGITFVVLAIAKANAKLVKSLIEQGAPFKEPLAIGPIYGLTPLVLAILIENTEVIEVLIQSGAILNDQMNLSKKDNTEMNSELYKIVKPVVDRLLLAENRNTSKLEVFKKSNQVETKQNSSNEIKSDNSKAIFYTIKTPLLFAVNTCKIELVKLLLENGADPLYETSEYLNAFFYSIDRKLTAISVLMARFIKNPHQVIENGSYAGITPFYMAAYHGASQVVEYFIDNCANVNEIITKGSLEGFTSAYSSACFGHYKTLELLIDAGADIHQALKRKGEECTSLISAINREHLEIVKLLIEKGKVDFQSAMKEGDSYQGTTPLLHAIAVGNLDIAKYLIEKGCDCNKVVEEGSFEGEVPLTFAIRHEQPQMVELLLDNGADYKKILSHSKNNVTPYFLLNLRINMPLNELFLRGYLDLARKVLRSDKNLYAPLSFHSEEYNGVNVLYLVLQSGNQPFIKFFLKESNFDINKEMESGPFKSLTTFEMAVKLKNAIVIKELKKIGAKLGDVNNYLMFGTPKEVTLLIEHDLLSLDFNYIGKLNKNVVKQQQKASINRTWLTIDNKQGREIIPMGTANVNRLVYAVLGKNMEVLKHFLKNKMDKPLVSSQDDMDYIVDLQVHGIKHIKIASGTTALFLASQLGYLDVIEYLILSKAAVNQRLNQGKNKNSTALHGAVLGNQLKAIELLIKHDANPFYSNINSQTPKELALSLNYFEIVKLLEECELIFNKKIQTMQEKLINTTNVNVQTKNTDRVQKIKTDNSIKIDQSPTILETPDNSSDEIREIKRLARLRCTEIKKTKHSKPQLESLEPCTKNKLKSGKNKKELKKKKLKKVFPTSDAVISQTTSQEVIKTEKQHRSPEEINPNNFFGLTPIVLPKKIFKANDQIDPESGAVIQKPEKPKNNIKLMDTATKSSEEIGIVNTISHYTQSISAALKYYTDHRNEEDKAGLRDLKEIVHNELSWSFMRLFESLSQYNNMLKKYHNEPLKDFIKGIHVAIILRNRIRYLNQELDNDDLINFALGFKENIASHIEKLAYILTEDKNIALEKLENTNLFVKLNTAYKALAKKLNLKKVRFNTLIISREDFEKNLADIIPKLYNFTKHFSHKSDANLNIHHISACNFLIDTLIREYLALTRSTQFSQNTEHKLFFRLEEYALLRNTMGHEMYEAEYDKDRHMFIESIQAVMTYEITTDLIDLYHKYTKNEDNKQSNCYSDSDKNSVHSFFRTPKSEKISNTEKSTTSSTFQQQSPLSGESAPFFPGYSWGDSNIP